MAMTTPRNALTSERSLLGLAALGLVALTLIGVLLSGGGDGISDRPLHAVPAAGVEQAPPAALLAERRIRFARADDLRLTVVDADSGARLVSFAADEGGFVRGVLRGLDFERRRHDVALEEPYRLSRWNDGRLVLSDPGNGQRIELVAFGRTNVQAFAQLLAAR